MFHFYRLFQGEMGMPIMQYILQRRLLNGIYEIAQGRKKIADVLAAWGLQKEPVTDIYYEESGNKNENACYVGDKYVIKFTPNYGKFKKHMELAAAIENVGLYTASLVKTEDGLDYVKDGELYFYLTNRLQGKQIVAGDMYADDYKEKARFVGEILGQLHLALETVEAAVETANLGETVKNWALPKAKTAMDLKEHFCKNYEQKMEWLFHKLPMQIIHRDPNPANIICKEDKWGFIDFELSERNVRIYDVCYAATAILSESFSGDDEAKLAKWLIENFEELKVNSE